MPVVASTFAPSARPMNSYSTLLGAPREKIRRLLAQLLVELARRYAGGRERIRRPVKYLEEMRRENMRLPGRLRCTNRQRNLKIMQHVMEERPDVIDCGI